MVLTDVQYGMPAYVEELFRPAAAIIPVEDDAKAVRVANDTVYALGATVFTRGIARGERIAAQELEAGTTCVNVGVCSMPGLPFRSLKESGYGRELSRHGLLEFVNVKTVLIRD